MTNWCRATDSFAENRGGGSAAIYHSARCCGSPDRRAVEVKESVYRTRTAGRSRSRVPALVLANGDNNSACHARKCKADSAMVDGFIFAVDFARLFAREVVNSGRCTE
jgi:hypothetical protein